MTALSGQARRAPPRQGPIFRHPDYRVFVVSLALFSGLTTLPGGCAAPQETLNGVDLIEDALEPYRELFKPLERFRSSVRTVFYFGQPELFHKFEDALRPNQVKLEI